MKKSTLLLLISFNISISAQIKGVVKDSVSGKPISFVNIWVENENNGATSEENGEFSIHTTEKSKNLIFSALGFEKKTIKIDQVLLVKLKPIEYQLDEVVILKRYETKQIEIGKTQNEIYQAFDNGPRIDTKFFPYKTKYKKTKFIKQVTIQTDSKIDNATIKIHFYNVDTNGFPGEEILNKDLLVSIKKGTIKSKIDVTNFNLKMPKNGLFVGFEKLIIEKNKTEKEVTDYNTNIKKIQKTYYPFILYNRVERDFLYTFSGGKWNRQTNHNDGDLKDKITIYEPAINLILTN